VFVFNVFVFNKTVLEHLIYAFDSQHTLRTQTSYLRLFLTRIAHIHSTIDITICTIHINITICTIHIDITICTIHIDITICTIHSVTI